MGKVTGTVNTPPREVRALARVGPDSRDPINICTTAIFSAHIPRFFYHITHRSIGGRANESGHLGRYCCGRIGGL